MATNPLGKGTKTIGVNMKLELAAELERRCTSMGISAGAYIKILLHKHFDSDKPLVLTESK